MAGEFEHRHGFPPGINEVRPADHDDRAAARTLVQVSLIPADLVTFYDSIGDITWEDVGNGYFIAPASDVLLRLQEYGPVDIDADEKAHGLVIGSNGGGLSYVAAPGGAVYRTRTATLDEPELDKVADDRRPLLGTGASSAVRAGDRLRLSDGSAARRVTPAGAVPGA
ncbi:SMI1/KNR4 family protein [Streptomyces muensis]|uniref:SMI1/KNR4 family protein n=1 Tax=Streptomyces muensis TaxID=1077944 RepID=A0A9X1PUG4_STRM4|nr:SMI1/KNR4 family protein [Streptomyces muensis]MCF1593732.1 SMI1/KNR4 family protein [Streptomyces muensis]